MLSCLEFYRVLYVTADYVTRVQKFAYSVITMKFLSRNIQYILNWICNNCFCSSNTMVNNKSHLISNWWLAASFISRTLELNSRLNFKLYSRISKTSFSFVIFGVSGAGSKMLVGLVKMISLPRSGEISKKYLLTTFFLHISSCWVKTRPLSGLGSCDN